jgi:predicted small metal-binding protein
MPRKIFDCRDWPGDCTLAISGAEHEVVEAEAVHVVKVHGQADSDQLRDLIRRALKDEPVVAWGG